VLIEALEANSTLKKLVVDHEVAEAASAAVSRREGLGFCSPGAETRGEIEATPQGEL